ncbi:DUF6531 domain-containing protein, partial [Halochromatium glycolicum]|nr:hypothetical protein [Halochromatium glycolicum]
MAALGNAAAATAIATRAQALEEKIGGLISDIDGLEPGGPAARAAAVLSKLEGTVKNLRFPRHPDRPVPTFSQEAPGPALSLPASSTLPAYITADAYERAGQMYAFNGDLLLLAAAPPTPGEAASCAYTSPDLADDGKDVTITQEIQDLAEYLDYSPARIFEYVANEIAFEPYYGALKGAQGTLETGAGSATDQSSLLIALLRASNIPARYVRGDVQFQDETVPEAEATVNRWLRTRSYAASRSRLSAGQNPTAIQIIDGGGTPVGVRFAHVWVEACVPYAHYRGARWYNAGHRWVPLDPSFETRRFEVGLSTAETFDFDAYLSGFNTKLPHEVFEAQVRQSLGGSDSLPDVGYRSEKLPLMLDILPASLPYHIDQFTDWSNSGAPETASLPDSHRYLLHVGVKNGSGTDLGASLSRRLAALLTVPLTLSFEGATNSDRAVLDDWRRNGGMLPAGLDLEPVVRIDGDIAAQGTGSVPSETQDNQLELSISLGEARSSLSSACTNQPGTRMINAVCFDGIAATNYHALQAYAFQAAENVLGDLADSVVENVNAAAALADDLDGTLGRFLHYAALKYMGDISDAAVRVGRLRGTTGDSGLHLGLTSTQSHVEKFLDLPFGINRQGFLIDVPGGQSRARELVTGELDFEAFVLAGYVASALETFIWQETARLDAVSTITGIQHASEVGSEILTINPGNRGTELPKVNTTANDQGNPLAYDPSFVTNVLEAQYLDQDFDEIKVPEERINFQGWEGYVLVATKFVLDAEPGTPGDQTVASASFPISGGFAGGYSVPDPTPVVTYNRSTGTGYVGGSTTTASGGGTAGDDQAIVHLGQGAVGGGSGTSSPHNTYAGDPVNLITGNFFHSERDLVIPYRDLPIVFERAYNSRNPADGPLGYGWTHSFNHRLLFRDEKPDGVEDALDTDGITSSVVWVDGAGGEKHLSVTGDATGVPIGAPITTPDGFQFTLTREPDGTYRLEEKSGLAYAFESVPGQVGETARLARITSRNANSLTLGYVGSELRTVTDDTGRAITFGYDGGRIASLTDWTGREHRYAYDGAGNLTAYRNPLAVAGEQPPVTYDYYTAADSPVIDHAIRSITLPKGNGLAFEYYADGRVFRHTNSAGETFTFQYNDFRRETLVTDARGFTTRTFFNEYGNPIEVIAPDGAVTTY